MTDTAFALVTMAGFMALGFLIGLATGRAIWGFSK